MKNGDECLRCETDPHCRNSASECTGDPSTRKLKCVDAESGYYVDEEGVVDKCASDKPISENNKCRAIQNDSDCASLDSSKPVFDNGQCRERRSEDCNDRLFVNGNCVAPSNHDECKSLNASKPVFHEGTCRERIKTDCATGHWLNDKKECEEWKKCDDTQIEDVSPSDDRNRSCRLPNGNEECFGECERSNLR